MSQRDRIIISFSEESDMDNYLLDLLNNISCNKRMRGFKMKELCIRCLQDHPELVPDIKTKLVKDELTTTVDNESSAIDKLFM